MKRCPQCNRIENDDTLVFCRSDGTALVSDSLPLSGEAGTARFGSAATEIASSSLPLATAANVSRSTGPTTVLPAPTTSTGTRELIKPKRSWTAIALVVLVAAAISLGGYFYFNWDYGRFFYNSRQFDEALTQHKKTIVTLYFIRKFDRLQ
jgi:hypothetical protein